MPTDPSPDLLPVSATRSPGDLNSAHFDEPSLWHQVDAFRELLQEGAQLLGEVLLFTKSAEGSLAALEREKAALDAEREALRKEKEGACHEIALAAEQLRAQEEELSRLREKLRQTEAEQALLEKGEAESSRSLQRALRETESRAQFLEAELQQLRRSQPVPVLTGVEEDKAEEEARLKNLERELEQTRLILAGERLRRNRAISLIRPSQGKGTPK